MNWILIGYVDLHQQQWARMWAVDWTSFWIALGEVALIVVIGMTISAALRGKHVIDPPWTIRTHIVKAMWLTLGYALIVAWGMGGAIFLLVPPLERSLPPDQGLITTLLLTGLFMGLAANIVADIGTHHTITLLRTAVKLGRWLATR